MDMLTAIPYNPQHFHPLDPHRYIIQGLWSRLQNRKCYKNTG